MQYVSPNGAGLGIYNPNPESASYTKHHGNGIYSTTHIIREDNAKPDKADKVKGPKCYKLMGPKWTTTPDYAAQNQDLLDIATLSIGTWNDESEFDLLGESSINELVTFDAVMDGENSYTMGDYPLTGVIAVCRTWWNSAGEIVEYDIMFDTDFSFGDASVNPAVMDFESIATHEIGHGFGLSDLYQKPCGEQTMFGYSSYGDISKRDLAYGDIVGIQTLYN